LKRLDAARVEKTFTGVLGKEEDRKDQSAVVTSGKGGKCFEKKGEKSANIDVDEFEKKKGLTKPKRGAPTGVIGQRPFGRPPVKGASVTWEGPLRVRKGRKGTPCSDRLGSVLVNQSRASKGGWGHTEWG